MYSFPDATEIRVLGGPADTAVQFNSPYKICFTPTGNLLVAEGSSRRIQEVSVDGAHIRFVGDLVIDDWVTIGLDCTTDLIVAGKDGRPKVLVFNYATGALLRSFCTSDTVPVKLSGSGGLRITPDGLHVIVACREAHTVVMLTLDGVFVRSIASGLVSSPRDIAFTSSGHMLIADAGNSCIRVLLPDGTACITSFSSEGMTPSGMALFGGKLYVIQDSLPGRLYVFE